MRSTLASISTGSIISETPSLRAALPCGGCNFADLRNPRAFKEECVNTVDSCCEQH